MKNCLILGMCAGFVGGAVLVTMYKPAREVVRKTTDAILEQISNEGNRLSSKNRQEDFE